MTDRFGISDVRSEALDPPLTGAERQAIEAARTAHAIVGGEPLVPYDVIGMAREVKRLRGMMREALDRIPDSQIGARDFKARLRAEVSPGRASDITALPSEDRP